MGMQPKLNNLQQAASSSRRRLESYLASAKDPSIKRWLAKSFTSHGRNSNDTLPEVCLRHQMQHQQRQREQPLTPAKKRSSLARPVRVHDALSTGAEGQAPVAQLVDWSEDQNTRNQIIQQQQQQICRHSVDATKKRHKENRKRKNHPLDNAIDDLVEIRVNEEMTNLPIRFRLGEFFELSLPKCRRRKRRRQRRMMIATMREKTMKSMLEAGGLRASRHQQGACRDTEHLLNVFGINNVDQCHRYSIARCSVM
ncbi:hypothetical protein QAD02_008628 [Eretmocerus hayati]|uniref:Uncharacterized protein n=1 Tax=Eretmocerus hayati TaxID=131215 RepID=A0ACC2N7B2_9HYME|nr:hypothetical protein QAD02_008628 [Eretmocerus hayati]